MSSRRFAQGFAVVLAIAALAAAASAYAAKPSSYSPTLGVSWPALGTTATTSGSSTSFVVSGCGYDSSLGGVTIVVSSPYATAFAGQLPDSNGCISLSNFATQGAGTYSIQAWQHVRNKDTVVASTSFTQ
jgi:hypothetical protein